MIKNNQRRNYPFVFFKRLFIATLFLSPLLSLAQIDYDKFEASNSSLVIKNVFLVNDPEAIASLQNIIIQDGKISKIGVQDQIPFDARVLELDSMYVYPGFIAGMSHVGMKKQEEDEEKIKFKGAPTNIQAGITPEKSILKNFYSKESSVERFRSNGILLANTVAHGKMITGKTAIVSLSGDKTEEMIISNASGIFSHFKSSGSVYPKTIIGNMAKWRDLYHNSSIAADYIQKYEQNPSIGSRPKYDAATKALIPVVKKEIPVFFKTQDVKEMYRAFELHSELGFDLIFTDCQQAWFAPELCKNENIKLLLSTDLPKEPKKIKEDEIRSDEQKELDKRQIEMYQQYISQAASLEAQNIEFAFSFIEGKASQLKPNLIKMIKAGLSKKTALAALTSIPAKMLQIDQLYGSISEGKIANLVITDKDFFDEKSRINFVIIEGKLYDYQSIKKKKKKTNENEVDISGTWEYEAEVFGQAQTGKVVIEKEEAEYVIKVYSSGSDEPALGREIELDGNKLSFSFDIETEMGNMDINMNLEYDEDTFEGMINGDFGSFPIEGSKISGPKNEYE